MGEFRYVQEWEDAFLALFPHRHDYIYASHPEPGQSPDWQTERRYPLSDRILSQGSNLFGVRFGKETNYCLLDIDVGSIYHPIHDRFAIDRILAALEPLGLVSPVICTSSYSQGLHLYFPFTEAQSSWEIALVVESLLQRVGFRLVPGQLELFPNPRPYCAQGNLGLFNAHRLPMQLGSYLLDAEFQPISCNRHDFVQHWQFAQRRNACLHRKSLKRLVKQFCRRSYAVSGKAEKFINDLNAEIELGWTGFGQTNRLLGRIALRTYIFHHVLFGGEPLEGEALVQAIVMIARSLPGYNDWCRHRHEIESRAAEWARCVESSHYFHFGLSKLNSQVNVAATFQENALNPNQPDPGQQLTWNQQRLLQTRERIHNAILDLLEKGSLPAQATARFHILTQYGIGGGALYRHRDLWHPNHLLEENLSITSAQIISVSSVSMTSAEGAVIETRFTSLLVEDDGNELPCKDLNRESNQPEQPVDGNNLDCSGAAVAPGFAASSWELAQLGSTQSEAEQPRVGIRYVQQILSDIRERLQRERAVMKEVGNSTQQRRQESLRSKHAHRMQQYLASGDPILMNEAKQWLIAKSNRVSIPAETDTLLWKETDAIVEGLQLKLPHQWENSFHLPFHLVDLDQKLTASHPFQGVRVRNFSHVLAQVQVYRECLGWTDRQFRTALWQQFGKVSQALLTDMELMEWSNWLAVQLTSQEWNQRTGMGKPNVLKAES